MEVLEKLFCNNSWVSIALVEVPRFCRDFAASFAQTECSHKNLGKPVNLDQIGFDLSDKEISAPDRSFVIDSVLGRGALSPAGYGLRTIETQNMADSSRLGHPASLVCFLYVEVRYGGNFVPPWTHLR